MLAFEPAPLVVNAEGFHGTSGAVHIAYNLLDSVVAPPEFQAHYSEAFIFVPPSFHVNAHASQFRQISRDDASTACRRRRRSSSSSTLLSVLQGSNGTHSGGGGVSRSEGGGSGTRGSEEAWMREAGEEEEVVEEEVVVRVRIMAPHASTVC